MTSERRENPRMPVTFDAVLNYDMRAVICTIRDISLTGAFLETDPTELPWSGTVEIGMSVNSKGASKYYRIPARIERVADNGAAVSFGDLGQDVYFGLVDLVYKS